LRVALSSDLVNPGMRCPFDCCFTTRHDALVAGETNNDGPSAGRPPVWPI
jgi:hypothetical protein